MEIGSKTPPQIQEAGLQSSGKTQNRPDEKTSAESNPAAREQLSLTPASQSLLSVLEGAEQQDINLAKVEALRSAIAEGRYQIDAQSIADSLTKMEKELP